MDVLFFKSCFYSVVLTSDWLVLILSTINVKILALDRGGLLEQIICPFLGEILWMTPGVSPTWFL